eukprot:TRINITY_DN8602_c0_g2_i1.p1 TRINITY_DN8602_c0_g2~~TRINITY_DN8602_c0_g2_i1.p1  ORF type:complete len:873 (+),score=224.29 TRINITY_DN8602_c0_g2_i1:206-2824(+)
MSTDRFLNRLKSGLKSPSKLDEDPSTSSPKEVHQTKEQLFKRIKELEEEQVLEAEFKRTLQASYQLQMETSEKEKQEAKAREDEMRLKLDQLEKTIEFLRSQSNSEDGTDLPSLPIDYTSPREMELKQSLEKVEELSAKMVSLESEGHARQQELEKSMEGERERGAKLKEMNTLLLHQIQDLTSKSSETEKKMEESVESAAKLVSQMSNLENEVKSLQQSLRSVEQDKTTLQQDKQDMETRLADLDLQVRQAQEHTKHAQEQLAILQQEPPTGTAGEEQYHSVKLALHQLEQDNAHLTATRQQEQAALLLLRTQMETLKQEVESMTQRCQDMTLKAEEDDKRIKKLERRREKYRATIKKLQEDNLLLKTEATTLSHKLEAAEQASRQFENSHKDLEGKMEDNREILVQFQDELGRVKESEAEKRFQIEKDLKNLNLKLNAEQEKTATLSEHLEEARAKLTKEEDNNKSLKERIEKKDLLNLQLTTRIEEDTRKSQLFQTDTTKKYQEEIDALTLALHEAKTKLNAEEEARQALHLEHSQFKTTAESATDNNLKLQAAVEVMTQQLKSESKKLDEVALQLDSEKAQNAELREALHQRQTSHEELEQNLAHLRDSTQEETSSFTARLAHLEAQLQERTLQYEQADAQCKEAEERLSSLHHSHNDQVTHLEEQLRQLEQTRTRLEGQVKSYVDEGIEDLKHTIQLLTEEVRGLRQDLELKKNNQIQLENKLREASRQVSEKEKEMTQLQKVVDDQKREIQNNFVQGGTLGPKDLKEAKQQIVNLQEMLQQAEKTEHLHELQTATLKEEIRELHRSTNRNVDLDYLKNVILKYLTTDDQEQHEQVMPVISSMLQFSPIEIEQIRTLRSKNKKWFKM